ncbi:MAG: methyltransferase family protein [Polyangiaceae bacterium]|jgi:protein-S-isoprenylcysteine O-methyltransferase Ste14
MQLWQTIDFGIWALFGVVWIVAARFTRKTIRREPIASRLIQGAPLLGAILLLPPYDRYVLPSAATAWLESRILPSSAPLGVLSVALTALGIGFAFWARYALGRNWSGIVTLKEGHHLITNGPYAFVRHPIYTGILFAIFGTLLGFGSRAWLLVEVLIAVSFRIKMRQEERFMTDQFGDEYAAYRQRARALIPFLW